MTNPTDVARDLKTADAALARLEDEQTRLGQTDSPDEALVKLLASNLRKTTKAGGRVDVFVNGKTRISKAGVSLGMNLGLTVTTPKSGNWRVLNVRGFNVSGTIPHTRALAVFAKIFKIAGE